jgi:nondiscriminating aspartyl-tRNA synthetase
MSTRVLSSELPRHAGACVVLSGWIHRIRDLGRVRFLVLRDRAGLAQVILPSSVDLHELNCESVVRVSGTVHAEPRAPGGHELHADRVELISRAQPPPIDVFSPVSGDETRLETLLDHRAVALRVPAILDVFRVQSEIVRAFRAHLNAGGFTEIFTPKLVLAGAEGGSAVFEIAYYDRKAYLGQSPQFYKQVMVGSGLERVFEVGHAYRAEKSETSRHLTEFVSLDFEMGFIESEQDAMRVLTETMRAIFDAVRERCAPQLARLGAAVPEIDDIPQIDYAEAKRILAERFGKTRGIDGDLDTEGERLIGQWAREELKSRLVYVTGYAASRRPAYAMPMTDAPREAASGGEVGTRSFDLLLDGVEISTGGQRIHDHEQLVTSFRGRGINPDGVAGYLEAFRHGMPPHGGMGLGLERFTKQLLGLANVKQASLFPRDRNRLTP